MKTEDQLILISMIGHVLRGIMWICIGVAVVQKNFPLAQVLALMLIAAYLGRMVEKP